MGLNLSSSRLGIYNACPWKYKKIYIHKSKRRRSTGNQVFGSIFHEVIAEMYSKRDSELPNLFRLGWNLIRCAKDEFVTDGDQENYDKFLKLQAIFEDSIKAWFNKFYLVDMSNERFKMILMEKKIQNISVSNTFKDKKFSNVKLNGIFDGLCKIDGEYWILEYKTKSRVSADLASLLQLDRQVSFYFLLGETYLKKPIQGILYRYLKIPSIYKRNEESEQQFIKRFSGRVNEQSLFEEKIFNGERRRYVTRIDLTLDILRLQNSVKNDEFPRNPDSCYGLYGSCEFLDECASLHYPTRNYPVRIKEKRRNTLMKVEA